MPAIEDLIESHDGMKSHKDRHAPTTSMDSLQSDQTPKEIDAPSSDAKNGYEFCRLQSREAGNS